MMMSMISVKNEIEYKYIYLDVKDISNIVIEKYV
jgi:hypothetical protein